MRIIAFVFTFRRSGTATGIPLVGEKGSPEFPCRPCVRGFGRLASAMPFASPSAAEGYDAPV